MLVDIISPMILTATTKSYATVYFARPYDLKYGTIGNRLRCVRPTLFLGVVCVHSYLCCLRTYLTLIRFDYRPSVENHGSK